MNSGNEIGFRQLFDRDTWTYTYMLFDPETLEGVIIDPVKEKFERDLQLLEELGIELKCVMDTHVHADHVTGSGLLQKQKVKPSYNYTTLMIKNEVNEKLKDLAKTYNLPKTKVLTILISDAHSKYIKRNPE